jgi:hypothetical protein
VDLIRIIGSISAGGIPKRTEFSRGDKIAVAIPTLNPNLYDAMRVKK